jgi:hypothetical protein
VLQRQWSSLGLPEADIAALIEMKEAAYCGGLIDTELVNFLHRQS